MPKQEGLNDVLNRMYKTKNSKLLISYSYFERENTIKNLDFFLTHGLKHNIDVIINCKSTIFSLDLNKYKYIHKDRWIK